MRDHRMGRRELRGKGALPAACPPVPISRRYAWRGRTVPGAGAVEIEAPPWGAGKSLAGDGGATVGGYAFATIPVSGGGCGL